ncbi:2-oxoglutarate dehydrogenase [Operophtera brumata]|uniref:2-oxoglutarate dehydrogenase n=1 Tax=Operophtera brumata TaxID=104452 RepID=A0A0L7LBU7_OPEBR|nr:2-oxoglutarate dehydrogenase [Operophtera brumata]
MEGRNVRLSGEDVGRGTFSHRHVMLVDQQTEAVHIPLNCIHPQQKGFLEVANSILSEEAVLGFEYGMAFDCPDNLYLWEAQFGDFYNGAQIIVDAFIASGECKILNYRKPLVIVAPKVLLRLADAVSPLSDLTQGTHFKTVIGDHIANHLKVKRVILVSGKHYYELNKERVKANIEDVAILRVEKFIWSQEEHRNMGAWSFIKPRFENLLGRKLVYAGRGEAATPAVGASTLHRKEVEHILREPLYNIK